MAKSKRIVPVAPVVILLVIGTIILIVGIILNPVFVDILHVEFKKMIPLSKSSSTLSTWKDPRDSVDMHMKFYFFDVQNPGEVMNGSKPNVTQKGPYTYNEIKIKEDVNFNTGDSTVTFKSPRSFVFNRSASVGTENDTFTTVNVPLLAVVTLLESQPAFEQILSYALKYKLLQNEPAFKRLSVYQILWGYSDTLMSDAAILIDIMKKLKPNISIPIQTDGYFGLFYKKNNTDDGLYQVKTGQDDLDKFMEVTEWNNQSSLSYWKTSYCNMINGTDGTMYHPFVKKTEQLFLFSSDLCRSIDVVYESSHFLDDIPQYRFKPPPSLFGYPPENDANACYCVGKGCPHAGVLNISQCQQGAPVFVSQPHFLNGDYYQSKVTGLSPKEPIHNTYIDVEPTTGIVMQGAKRLQMNLAVERNPYVKELSGLPKLLFPLLWLEEGALINSKGIDSFKDMFFNIQQTVTMLTYLFIVIGGLIIIFTLMYVASKYYKYWRNSKDPERAPLVDGPINSKQQATPAEDPDKDWGRMKGDDID